MGGGSLGHMGCPPSGAGGPWCARGTHQPECGVTVYPPNKGRGSLGSTGCSASRGGRAVGPVGSVPVPLPGWALGDSGHISVQVVLSRQYGSEGRFTFTSHTPGEHQICLHSNSTRMALFAGGKLVTWGVQGGGVSGGGASTDVSPSSLDPRSGCTWTSRWANTPTTTPKSPLRTN